MGLPKASLEKGNLFLPFQKPHSLLPSARNFRSFVKGPCKVGGSCFSCCGVEQPRHLRICSWFPSTIYDPFFSDTPAHDFLLLTPAAKETQRLGRQHPHAAHPWTHQLGSGGYWLGQALAFKPHVPPPQRDMVSTVPST